jgi:hypothetical protein
MLFIDGRRAKRAWPVVREYIRPNVKPKKSNSPSGTVQICVLSSFTVSFSLPIISRRRPGHGRRACDCRMGQGDALDVGRLADH